MSLRSLAHIGVSDVVLSVSTTDSLFVSQSLAQCELSLLTLISPRSACTRLPEEWYVAIEVADFVADARTMSTPRLVTAWSRWLQANSHIWVTPLANRSWRPVILEIDISVSSTGELNIIPVAEKGNCTTLDYVAFTEY